MQAAISASLTCAINLGTANSSMPTEAALDAICQDSCVGVLMDYLVGPPCSSVSQAEVLRLWCLPAYNAAFSYCRFALDPTLFQPRDGRNLTACLGITTECPDACSTALRNIGNTIGSCFQDIYNNTNALQVIVQEGQAAITQDLVDGISSLQNPTLWNFCGIPIPETSTAVATTTTACCAIMVHILIGVLLAFAV